MIRRENQTTADRSAGTEVRADADRLRRALRGARRPDLSAQSAVDRGDARHELRLAGPRDPAPAETRRKGARTGCRRSWASSRRSFPFRSSPPSLIAAVGYFGLMRTSYGAILRGCRRQRARDRARRLVAAQGQGRAVRAGRRLRRAVGHGAGRHHDFGRRQHRQRLYAACRSPASSSAAANSSADSVSPVGAVHRRADAWRWPPRRC